MSRENAKSFLFGNIFLTFSERKMVEKYNILIDFYNKKEPEYVDLSALA